MNWIKYLSGSAFVSFVIWFILVVTGTMHDITIDCAAAALFLTVLTIMLAAGFRLIVEAVAEKL